jgi:uncharacterized membrane protein
MTMKYRNSLALSALAGAIALGAQGLHAAEGDMEKCYGIAEAGKNDCATATSS